MPDAGRSRISHLRLLGQQLFDSFAVTTVAGQYPLVLSVIIAGMADIVVSFEDETDLELKNIEIGRADNDDVLAFTVEGVIRGLNPDLISTFAEQSVVPSEIHFRIDGE